MNVATNNRLIVSKAILWFLVGIAGVVTAIRYARGLGAATALTDITPWGLWIGFDVLAGVALAAGGFVIAATVYILGRERYHGIVRSAILTAFLGYLAVIIGLLVDLGRPWNIWRCITNQNLHSPLFEVAMCVMLYTAVLALEFAPVGLERFRRAEPIVKLLRKLSLPLVITGICLSTLHQSSLGTLFLLSEPRMHPLWYSPLLPLLFLVSAAGLGLAMVTLESLITSWLYKREPEWPELGGLTRAAAAVLGLYLLVRVGDLAVRGRIAHALEGSWMATLFWVELVTSTIAPILLFSLPATAGRRWAITSGSILAVAGFILHRADVGGISHIVITGQAYVPALSELAVSVGIVAGLGLIFLFCVEKLQVWEEKPATPDHFTPPAVDPISLQFIRAPWLGSGQRAALAWILGAVVGIGLMDAQLASRRETRASPVRSPRSVLVARAPRGDAPGHQFELLTSVAVAGVSLQSDEGVEKALLIDSGGAGRFVLFGHEEHQRRLGGHGSCGACHHLNVPLDQATSCVHCHRDMYRLTDTFEHELHEREHGGKASCAVCHVDPAAPKNRLTAKRCDDCHAPVSPEITQVSSNGTYEAGVAPGYKLAMHNLCVTCHRKHETASGVEEPYLGRCAACHRDAFGDEREMRRRTTATLAAAATGR